MPCVYLRNCVRRDARNAVWSACCVVVYVRMCGPVFLVLRTFLFTVVASSLGLQFSNLVDHVIAFISLIVMKIEVNGTVCRFPTPQTAEETPTLISHS